jgi:PAS domain S-box-containing protein
MTPQSYGRQSRQASHESEEIYRLLAENSTAMISKQTSEGVYTYASPACRSLLGYEPDELVGHSAHEFLHPEDLEQTSRKPSEMQQHPDPYTVTYRIRRKDGSYIWFETTSRSVQKPGTGEVLEMIAVSRDITDRKRVEEELHESQEALRKSEQFHRFAVEAGRIGTWDLDLRTYECLVSPKMAELMGFSRDQTSVPGAQWRESIIPKDRVSMASALTATIENDAPFDLEFRIALKDGRKRWLYSRGGATRDPSGKALRVHGASIDVTERKRTEERLRASEGRLQRAIDIETVGVIFFTTDGSITDANDAFLRMSGYSREDLAGGLVRWDVMTPPEWMSHSRKAIEEFRLTGRTIPYEKEYVRKDGSRWCALFAATRLDKEEGVEFIIDITERKRAEDALAELLRARTEFMANVSHELRTPLTVIRGNAEVGLELGRDCVHEEILEEIVRESDSLTRMMEDLLFLARSDSDSIPLDKQMVPVEWLLSNMARRAEALASERDTYLQTTLSGEGRLGCDTQSLEQAVLVLVDNAAKYGKPGESITLSSSTRHGELLIEVADRGPGIPTEEQPQIFERFYRGEDSPKERGSGLGLAIAKTIAEAHDGSVEAESRPGEGTRMILRLPLAKGS